MLNTTFYMPMLTHDAYKWACITSNVKCWNRVEMTFLDY